MPVETVDRLAQELDAEAQRVRTDVDSFFTDFLAPTGDGREQLYEAMRYAAVGGGKRLRPLLTVAAARLFAIDRLRALRVGCAIEANRIQNANLTQTLFMEYRIQYTNSAPDER